MFPQFMLLYLVLSLSFKIMNPESTIINPVVTEPVSSAAVSVKYAGFWIRWVANIIDGFVLGTLFLLVSIFQVIFVHAPSDLAQEIIQGIVSMVVKVVLTWVYFVWMTDVYGATLGKKAVGVMVTAEDGTKLPIGRIILRETIGKWVSAIILMIGFIMAGFTKKKQALHDKMAKSVVVYKNPEHKSNGVVIAVVVVFGVLMLVSILGILSSVVLASLNVARQKGNDAIVRLDVDNAFAGAMTYYQSNKSFSGFQISATSSDPLPACSSYSVNVAPNGQEIAIFGKLCSKQDSYICSGLSGQNFDKDVEVDSIFAQSGTSTCR